MFVRSCLNALSASILYACTSLAQQPSGIAPVTTTVVVLGTPTPVVEAESSRSLTVIATDPESLPLAPSDLPDVLRADPSVDIQQRGAYGAQADLAIRGTSFEQSLVLVNGLRLNDSETAHFNLDTAVPIEAIGSVEVLHGAGSTLYGSDALGGVVDLITLKPETSTLRLTSSYGSFSSDHESVLASVLLPHTSEVLAADRVRSLGFIADRDLRSEAISSETRLSTPLGDTGLLLAASDRPYGAANFYGNYPSFERTKGWFAALTQPFGEHTSAALAYRRHTDIFILFRDRPLIYKNQHIDQSYQAVLRHARPFHFGGRISTFAAGLEENTDQIDSNQLGHHGRNRGAGYAAVDLQLPRKITLSAGLREEVLSGGTVVTSPSASVAIPLASNLTLHASVGRGFRIPTYVDLYYADPATLGNPNLKPETAITADTGLDWHPSSHLTLTSTGFYTHQANAIDYLLAPGATQYKATNLNTFRILGLESSAALALSSHQQLRFDWTILSGAQQSLDDFVSRYFFNYPTHNAAATYNASLANGLELQARLAVVQRYQQTAYPVLNLDLARRRGRVQPFVNFTNLTNTGYQEIAGVPVPGRAISGGVQLLLTRPNRPR